MAKLKVQTSYSEAQLKGLFGRLLSAKDSTLLKTEIGQFLVEQTRNRIRRRVSPDGTPWAPRKARVNRRSSGGSSGGRPRKTLVDSIMFERIKEGVRVVANSPVAAFLQFGTKPHVIRPKKKKALYWDGAPHPVKKVNHPGTVPRPFMGKGRDDVDGIRRIVRTFLKRKR